MSFYITRLFRFAHFLSFNIWNFYLNQDLMLFSYWCLFLLKTLWKLDLKYPQPSCFWLSLQWILNSSPSEELVYLIFPNSFTLSSSSSAQLLWGFAGNVTSVSKAAVFDNSSNLPPPKSSQVQFEAKHRYGIIPFRNASSKVFVKHHDEAWSKGQFQPQHIVYIL